MTTTPQERRASTGAKGRAAKAITGLSIWYDRQMAGRFNTQYYGGSDFWNFGLWDEGTLDQKQASSNLVEKVLSFIPEKQGRILDVACGLGATTRQVTQYYPAKDVTALNISTYQLSRTLTNVPGANVVAMDAAQLGFPDETFDNVICVEAAFHFRTRDQFYREAYRVLKPGGRLVQSDILLAKGAADGVKENFVRNPEAMREQIRAAGFDEVRVFDTTKECWGGFKRNMRRWPAQERKAGRIGFLVYFGAKVRCTLYPLLAGLGMRSYVISSARKPVKG